MTTAPSPTQPRLNGPQPAQPAQSAPRTPPADLRLDKVVSLKPITGLEGRVIGADNTAQAGTRVLFINAANSRERQTAASDASGQFRAPLAAGRWLVYVQACGRPGRLPPGDRNRRSALEPADARQA